MRNLTSYLLCLLIGVLLLSCESERNQILQRAEHILPGFWEIKSVKLPRDPMGVTYQDNQFFADTTLFDIGTIDIPNFSTDSMQGGSVAQPKVKCGLEIDGEHFPISMDVIIPWMDQEVFIIFRYNGPHGVFPIDTPGKKFFWSSWIFNNNYRVEMIDHDNVLVKKANDYSDHVITLSRKQ